MLASFKLLKSWFKREQKKSEDSNEAFRVWIRMSKKAIKKYKNNFVVALQIYSFAFVMVTFSKKKLVCSAFFHISQKISYTHILPCLQFNIFFSSVVVVPQLLSLTFETHHLIYSILFFAFGFVSVEFYMLNMIEAKFR